MNTTITCVAFLLMAGSLAQADSEPDRSKEAGMRDFQGLDRRNSQAVRLSGAATVLVELKGSGVNEADAPAPGPAPVPEQLFVNTAWKTAYGTTFEFQEDQRGIRSFGDADRTAFNWKCLPNGLVEVRGPFRKGELEVTWYFRFVSKKEAFYGPHTNEVTRPLGKVK